MTRCQRCHRNHDVGHVHAAHRRGADVIEDFLFLRASGMTETKLIAARMGMPVTTLRQLLNRAGIYLRELS